MKKLAIFFLLILSSPLYSHIIETDDIRTILNHVYDTHHHKEILVVFDIDNTLGHVADGFGGDEWFYAMMQKKLSANLPFNIALQEVLPLYMEIQKTLWLTPVQPETPRLITFLQDVNVACIALTARTFLLMDRTFEQLNHMHINFTRNMLWHEAIDLTLTNVAHYRDGVIFSGENNKGELLVKFLKHTNYRPKKIIYVDDKRKYVEQVEQALKIFEDITYIGIRYNKLDEKAATYNLEEHQNQLEEFLATNHINDSHVAMVNKYHGISA